MPTNVCFYKSKNLQSYLKMTIPGTCYHDFPRLATQSGYFFRLYKGEVNWSEIEQLSVEDVIEKRNFQLLEKNLVNVVNIKLEEEQDLKILDEKFLKLFKLAQLGVDYLSYCLMYVDRCVILLQEQLIIYQKECEELKRENERKTEDLQKLKKKHQLQNYRCEICHKVFISETYLKFHDKRRHSTTNTSQSLNEEIKKVVNAYQQTDEDKRVTASTQTSLVDEVKIKQPEINDTDKNVEVENFQKELEDLKIRIQKAESTLSEKKEILDSGDLSFFNFAAPVFYPFREVFFPSYYMQPRDYFCQNNLGYLPQNSEYYQLVSFPGSEAGKVDPEKGENSTNNVTKSMEKVIQKDDDNVTNSKKINSSTATTERVGTKYDTKHQKNLIFNKENISPKKSSKSVPVSTAKSLILPNNAKNFEVLLDKEKHSGNKSLLNTNSKKLVQSETVVTSTSLQNDIKDESQVQILENLKEDLNMKLNEMEINFNQSSTEQKILDVQESQRSFNYSKIFANSPHLHEFQKSTNSYDSVSPKLPKTLEITNKKSSTFQINSLDNQLKELGVDPSWSGIPTNTLKLNLLTLKHRRKLLTKENPMYLVIRESIRQQILQKLKNSRKKSFFNDKEYNTKSHSGNLSNTKPNMYKIDSDSESEIAGSEIKENVFYKQNGLSNSIFKNEESGNIISNVTQVNKNDCSLSTFLVTNKNAEVMESSDESIKL